MTRQKLDIPGHPGRRGADPPIRRDRLHGVLWQRRRRLRPGRLRRPRPHGQGRGAGVSRPRAGTRRRRGRPRPAQESGQRQQERRGTPPPGPSTFSEIRLRRHDLTRDIEVPEPPFWGPRVLDDVRLEALLPYLNDRMLFQFHWGYRKNGRRLKDYMKWARRELRGELARIVELCRADEILLPQAVYGYWPLRGGPGRPDPVRSQRTGPGSGAFRAAAPGPRKRALHRRLSCATGPTERRT